MQDFSVWYAFVKEDGTSAVGAKRVVVVRDPQGDGAFTAFLLGQTAPYDWIEYEPDRGRLVERDGDLWLQQDDGVDVRYLQITKAADPRRTP